MPQAFSLTRALTVETTRNERCLRSLSPCLAGYRVCGCAVQALCTMSHSCDKSASGQMETVTVILSMPFCEIYDVVGSKCNCNLVKFSEVTNTQKQNV